MSADPVVIAGDARTPVEGLQRAFALVRSTELGAVAAPCGGEATAIAIERI